MQPVFTHVPPNNLRSMIATFMPAPARRLARNGPACPVPMMIASNRFVMTIERSQLRPRAAQFSLRRKTAGAGLPDGSIALLFPHQNRHDPEENHGWARGTRDDDSGRSGLLDQNEASQRCDPDKVHHSHYKENAHQRPTAAKAKRPVVYPHLEGAKFSVAPVGHQEPQRASAMRQAFAFPGSQLIGKCLSH